VLSLEHLNRYARCLIVSVKISDQYKRGRNDFQLSNVIYDFYDCQIELSIAV